MPNGTSGQYTAPATGTLASVKVTDGTFSATATVSVVSPPYSQIDIGGPNVPGVGYDSSGTFSVKGSGNDIFGTFDLFHYVYRTLSGDGSITARVISQSNTNSSAKAGVMIRNSLNSGDATSMMAVTPGAGITFQNRAVSGGSTVQTSVIAGLIAPYYVRLVAPEPASPVTLLPMAFRGPITGRPRSRWGRPSISDWPCAAITTSF